MYRFAVVPFLSLIAASLWAQEPVSYNKQLRPILARSCQGCHQSASPQSDLSLVSFKDFKTGGKKGAAIGAAIAHGGSDFD